MVRGLAGELEFAEEQTVKLRGARSSSCRVLVLTLCWFHVNLFAMRSRYRSLVTPYQYLEVHSDWNGLSGARIFCQTASPLGFVSK
jgi:hypothetical protein